MKELRTMPWEDGATDADDTQEVWETLTGGDFCFAFYAPGSDYVEGDEAIVEITPRAFLEAALKEYGTLEEGAGTYPGGMQICHLLEGSEFLREGEFFAENGSSTFEFSKGDLVRARQVLLDMGMTENRYVIIDHEEAFYEAADI